ncbi:MAG: penicillin acylase family protein [Anaerolineae bacterium]|nr:penicillin acylase family protein [Anaerolineae bacterium]
MKIILRLLLIFILIIALSAAGLAGAFLYISRRPLPQYAGTLSLPGLQGEVTILRDEHGIPHIYASTIADLFFAEGVIHAQDRWWQMEFQRHVGMGRISELVGKRDATFNSDRFIRTIGWNRAAQADAATMSPESKAVMDAYSAGINAYIGGKSGGQLAFEYSLLGITGVNIPVEPWEAVHTFAWAKVMAWQLSGDYDFELGATLVAKRLDPDRRAAFMALFPPAYPYAEHPPIVRDEDLPVTPQKPGAAGITVSHPPLFVPEVDYGHIQTRLVGDSAYLDQLLPAGMSNSWVISGARATSGKPLMANDPHLGIQMPSLFYPVGLHCRPVTLDCPFDVTGFSLPSAPGVLIGHNTRIAWGLTTPNTDTMDLYTITVDPNDSSRYLVDGESLPFEIVTEEIKFGDGEPSVQLPVRVTRFGPILTDIESYKDTSELPLALKWAGSDGGYDIVAALINLNKATDWDEFRAALKDWGMPSQNFVYADVDGNIGYQLPGRVPIRHKDHSGMSPADGSTKKYDWRGYIPFEYMPRIYNPARGYIVTANHAIVPPAFNAQLAEALSDQFGADSYFNVDHVPAYGYRAWRAEELLLAKDQHDSASFKLMQADNLNLPAYQILPAALNLDFGTAIPADVLEWMGQWNYRLDMGSGQALLYEKFYNTLSTKIWQDELQGEPSTGDMLMWSNHLLLDQPNNPIWDDLTTTNLIETRDEIIKAAFMEAYQETIGIFGADYRQWKWGDAHLAAFVSNPLGASGIGPIESYVNGGPVGIGGGTATLNRASYASDGGRYYATTISTLRIIYDFSDFDQSLWMHTTGQSGHPASNHYRDLIELWRNVQFLPMISSQAGVEGVAKNTLKLVPQPPN